LENYNFSKNYDLLSKKNNEEDESRNETTGTRYFDVSSEIIKSIHSKKREFR